ncbi:MAG: PilZ domain-containing protein [Pyrinomonadaceae bacterium]
MEPLSMSEIDRRKSGDEDRRRTRRFAISIDVEWENHYGRRTGTLGDISEEGCFILTEFDVSDGELVKIFIPLSDGMKVEFLGQVANFVYEIGFAVHFLSLSEPQKEFLANFVEMHSEGPPA